MACTTISISQHAFARAVERGIRLEDAVEVARTGEVIATYPDDKPYPSQLMLGFSGGSTGHPIHVVVGEAPDGLCTVITIYVPSPAVWAPNFKSKLENPKP